MRILVCLKQVPNTQEISIDPITHTLVRQGVESIINPFDGHALEAAARLKDSDPSVFISVLSMGPRQAEDALREALSIAADNAYLVSDTAFGGSDTLATSYTLSEAIKAIEQSEDITFDLVFCGKQAIDGDTAQVGPQIAQLLDLPQITNGLTCSLENEEIHVTRESEEGKEVIAATLPCLVTFTKPDFEPRFATVKRRMAAKRAEIKHLGLAELPSIDTSRIGLKGSPTQVVSTFVPHTLKATITLSLDLDPDAVTKLASALVADAIITELSCTTSPSGG